jgi:5-methylcytosine-specific restriction endonuclease McrA
MTRTHSDRRYYEKRRSHPDVIFLKSKDWRLLRRVQLAKDPFCKHCQLRGYLVIATEVDHIEVPNGDPVLQRSPSNFQSLCKQCHGHKTRHQGKQGPLVIGWDTKGNKIEVTA